MTDLLQQLAEKRLTKQKLQQTIESNFDLLPTVFKGVSSPKAQVRYGCASTLVNLSGKYPEKLYQYMDDFIQLLDSKYRILVWNAMAAIANLCAADADRKFDSALNKFYSYLNDEYMVTVANTVGNSAKIVRAKPYLAPRITAELLRVDSISTSPHLTEECKKVIVEKAVETFNQFFDLMGPEEKANVLNFVKNHVGSSRASLRKEALLFLEQRSP